MSEHLDEYRDLLRRHGRVAELPSLKAYRALCQWIGTHADEYVIQVVQNGLFTDGKSHVLIVPPDQETSRKLVEVFTSAELRGAARKAMEAVAAAISPKRLAKPWPNAEEVKRLVVSGRPVWDGLAGRWINAEGLCPGNYDKKGRYVRDKKELARFLKSGIMTTPPGSWPPKPLQAPPSPRKIDHRVDGLRLNNGMWGVEQGDIDAAYSAEPFSSAAKKIVVKTFDHEGKRWTNVGSSGVGPFAVYVTAHELKPGKGRHYVGGKGYAGSEVWNGGKRYVLGKEAVFAPDDAPKAGGK